MEALEELAVSYERQDGEMEASNEEKVVLQCEIEKLQVGLHVTLIVHFHTGYHFFPFYIPQFFHSLPFCIPHFYFPFHSMSCRREHSNFWLFRKLVICASGLLPTWYSRWWRRSLTSVKCLRRTVTPSYLQ